MFQFQSLQTPSMRKRGREDDDDSSMDEARSEKRSRNPSTTNLSQQFSKPQALAFRPSPRTSPSNTFIFPRTITPEYEDEKPDSPGPLGFPYNSYNDAELDVEMADDEQDFDLTRSASPETPVPFLRPSKLHHQSMDEATGGRIPTPIHSNFLHRPAPRSSANTNITEEVEGSPGPVPPLYKIPDIDRRMPSPISEDEVDTPTYSSQFSHLSVDEDDRMDSGMEGMEVESTIVRQPAVVGMGERRGRARSGAIVQQKKRFVMGFRDDCEKCRLKQPQHFGHFLPV